MIERSLTASLRAALGDTPVAMLVGARQAGKSTLVTSLDLVDAATGGEYVSFDDPTALAATRADPAGFLAGLGETAVLDEVQRAPELFLPIKAAVDRDRRPGRFLLTGSANPLFVPAVAEALAGRMEVLTLWPFSAAELEGRPRERLARQLLAEQQPPPVRGGRQSLALPARMVRGGFPEAVERDDPERRGRWFSSYLTTILERDVRSIADIARLEQLPAVLTAVALRSRGPLNKSGLSQDLGIPGSSIDRYLTLLERVFLVRRLPAWHNRLHPRLVKAPKLLVADSGLLCHLLRLDEERLRTDRASLGLVLESFVGMELVKSAGLEGDGLSVMHYRTPKGTEIDFVLEAPDGRVAAIEVKASSSVGRDDFKRFERLREVLGPRFVRGVVLYTGDRTLPFGDRLAAWPVSVLWRAR